MTIERARAEPPVNQDHLWKIQGTTDFGAAANSLKLADDTTRVPPPDSQHRDQDTLRRQAPTDRIVRSQDTTVNQTSGDKDPPWKLWDQVACEIYAPPPNTKAGQHDMVNDVKLTHELMFESGNAGSLSPEELVRDGIFISKPLEGSCYIRHADVQFIVLHSTETATIADAQRVIRSWNAMGDHGKIKHPGAQFVIDRDGKIYMAESPDYATFHVDDDIVQGGVHNQNAVGIEMVRTGKQQYTNRQLKSAEELVAYIQQHYCVPDNHIVAHGKVQPQTRRDPLHFDFPGFQREEKALIEPGPQKVAPSQVPDHRGRQVPS